ncbi:MAG: hypothetical protein ACLTA2_02870 [[Clostridium] innocuum]
MKNKKLLFVKLTGLTLAIYWFISKGGDTICRHLFRIAGKTRSI